MMSESHRFACTTCSQGKRRLLDIYLVILIRAPKSGAQGKSIRIVAYSRLSWQLDGIGSLCRGDIQIRPSSAHSGKSSHTVIDTGIPFIGS